MTDQGRQELAESYRNMMQTSAWKHFDDLMTASERSATQDEDSVEITDMAIAKIAECRGRRRAIRYLRSSIDFILSGTN